jgi:hypothetical protein
MRVKPYRIRRRARPYRLVKRKQSRYIAVRLRDGKQRSSKCELEEEAKSFAYRWIAEVRPDLAEEIGIEVTRRLKLKLKD